MATVGEALIQLLERYGVSTIFGIPGVHNLEMYRGLDGSSIRHVQARHEQGAAFMADGYARATGQPGVCLVISGPGVTNAATGLGQSYADSIPVLMISAVTRSESLGKGWGELHEITDQSAVTAPLTALSATAMTAAEVPELVARAFSIFSSERPRPVHIGIPLDVAEHEVSDEWTVEDPPTRPRPDAKQVEEAATLLRGAARPVIVAGGGSIGAGSELTALAQRLDAAVIMTNAGKGTVAASHPLAVHATATEPAVQDHLAAADVVLAIGTELAETDCFIEELPLTGSLVRVDIDPAKLDDRYPADVGLHADATATAAALLAQMGAGDPPANGAEAQVTLTNTSVNRHLVDTKPRHVSAWRTVLEVLPPDTMILADMTQLTYTGTAVVAPEAPRRWLFPAGYCTLGSALPCAIGAKLAAPDRPAFVVVGDGGFMFTAPELMTAIQMALPIPVLIWNNHGFKQIADDMTARDIEPLGTDGLNPDFVALAEAMGAHGRRPDSTAELAAAIKEALDADRPTVIEVLESADWLAGG